MSSSRKANAALGAAVLFLLLSSWVAYSAFVRLHNDESWVRHTRDVQSVLAKITVITSRAGRLRAEFVDSGDLSLLEEQADMVRELRNDLTLLQQLTSDNQAQLGNNRHLQELSEQRIALMNSAIELKKTGKSTLEAQAGITRQIVATAAETDGVLQSMFDNEDLLLAARQTRVRNSTNITVGVLIASLFLTLILFIVHHRLLTDQVKARTQTELALRALSIRLLTLQDEERRKFARELHDSVGQHLVATKMGLSMLQSKIPNESILQDCLKLLDDSIAETRTISHLLHPPLLDEAGLNSASRWFVEGFGKRSGVETKLDIRDGEGRLPEAVELGLFRILQESLTNVHRHSGARKAHVSLNTEGNSIVLRVKDDGKGMPAHVLESLQENGASGGVGLAGMTERIHEIGGRLEIHSNAFGTEIVARVPVQRAVAPPDLSPPTVREA